jgi:hypothetical protein
MLLTIYLRRPGRYLVRTSTSIAGKYLTSTSNKTSREREKYFDRLGCMYGYSRYVG